MVGSDEEIADAILHAQTRLDFGPYTASNDAESAAWNDRVTRAFIGNLSLECEEEGLKAKVEQLRQELEESGFHALTAARKALAELKDLPQERYEEIRRKLLLTHPEVAVAFERVRLGPTSEQVAQQGLSAFIRANTAQRAGKTSAQTKLPSDPTKVAEALIGLLLEPLKPLADKYYTAKDKLDALPMEKRRAEQRLHHPHGKKPAPLIYLKRA
jgi:hypothetical protein